MVGSALYGWAWLSSDSGSWQRHGPAIAIAAGLSWIVFGAGIGAVTRFRPSVWSWADLCLRVMAIGITPLILAAALVWSGITETVVHVGLLLVSNGVMLTLFARGAMVRGMPLAVALALWVLVLDGIFILLLLVRP